MIEKIKTVELSSKFGPYFELFNDSEGNLKIAGKEETTSNDGKLSVVDFETGKMKSDINVKFNNWNGWMKNIESMRCLVGYASNTLFTIQYDDEFRTRKDYKLKEQRCGDIYKGGYGACVYHEHMIAFLIEKNINAVVFYNLKKEKLIDIIDGKSVLSILTSDSVDFILLGYTNQDVVLIDKSTRKDLYKFSFSVSISDRNVFFDYSGKYSFGICDKAFSGLNMFTVFPSGTVEKKHFDYSFNAFYCDYAFGDDFFFGDNLVDNEGMIQYFHKNEVKNIHKCEDSNFEIRNKGKDIFVFIKFKDDETKKSWFCEIMHFVNRDLMFKKIDPDEIERIEYIRNMEDEKVEILKISVLNVIDFYCFKSNLF